MENHQDWEAVISDWRSSGLSQSEYCRRSGIKEHQFSYWKRKLGKPEAVSNFVSVSGVASKIELSVGKVNLKLPVDIKAERIAELVKCLS